MASAERQHCCQTGFFSASLVAVEVAQQVSDLREGLQRGVVVVEAAVRIDLRGRFLITRATTNS